MATSYEKLYENLLPKFRSYEIPLMSTEEVKDYLHDFLIPAVSRFHVCRKDLNDRDDIVQRFNVDLSDVEIEILSNYLLIEYIDSEYIRTPSLLKVQLPSSDFKVFSPAHFLDKLMAMRHSYLVMRGWVQKNQVLSLVLGIRKTKDFNERWWVMCNV